MTTIQTFITKGRNTLNHGATLRGMETDGKPCYEVQESDKEFLISCSEIRPTAFVDATSAELLLVALRDLKGAKALWTYTTQFLVIKKSGDKAVMKSVLACTALEALVSGASAFVAKPVKAEAEVGPADDSAKPSVTDL